MLWIFESSLNSSSSVCFKILKFHEKIYARSQARKQNSVLHCAVCTTNHWYRLFRSLDFPNLQCSALSEKVSWKSALWWAMLFRTYFHQHSSTCLARFGVYICFELRATEVVHCSIVSQVVGFCMNNVNRIILRQTMWIIMWIMMNKASMTCRHVTSATIRPLL